MKVHFICACILAIIISSCKKDANWHTTVKGKVVEKDTGKPIKGATVILAASGGLFSPPNTQPPSSCTSDVNGNYSFDFTAVEQTGYVVAAQIAPYDNSDWIGINTGQTNYQDIHMTGPAWIKIHAKNMYGSHYLQIDYPGTATWTLIKSPPTTDTSFVARFFDAPDPLWLRVITITNKDTSYPQQIIPRIWDTIPVAINY